MNDFLLSVLTLVLFLSLLTFVTILEKKASKRYKP
jgi:hypothetical protein